MTTDRPPPSWLWLVALLLVLAIVASVRLLPLQRPGTDARLAEHFVYTAADGRRHVYLGDYDSYYWLRLAHNYLQRGMICDRVVDGECRDDLTHAPLGGTMKYPRSLHVHSIAWVHRLMTWWRPGFPLPSSAALVPLLVGVLGVFPAFALGWRVGGLAGAVVAALIISLNPLFLLRSIGSDNDVWNVVLPLFLATALLAALHAASLVRSAVAAFAALAVAAVHALTWDGWMVGYAVGFAAALTHLVVLCFAPSGGPGERRGHGVAATVLTCLVLGLAPVAAAVLRPERTAYLVESVVTAVVSRPLETKPDSFPSAMSTVGESAAVDPQTIAATLSGMPQLLFAWVGMLLMFLPRYGWRRRHYLLLSGGIAVLVFLLLSHIAERAIVVPLLGLPLAAAVVLSWRDAVNVPARDRSVAFLTSVWFLVAFTLSLDGLRFVILLLPAFGLGCAALAGRVADWTRAAIGNPAVAVIVLLLLALPLRDGYRAAAQYTPRMNDAWWDTLAHIAATTPPAAIVTTWWPYGFWAEYVGQRRTTVDGSAVPTHVPYWVAQALFAADERQAIGLLRMLDCASDLTPRPGKWLGGYGRLRWEGWSEAAAAELISRITSVDRAAAIEQLVATELPADVVAAVVDATHCDPPPAYLVLSSSMVGMPGWRQMGAMAQPGDPLGPAPLYHTKTWVECRAATSGSAFVCPLRFSAAGKRFEQFTYSSEAPGAGRFGWRSRSGAVGAEDADVVFVAGSDSVTEIHSATAPPSPAAQLGVLVDSVKQRILVGTPALLRSTYTDLMFLEGRYTSYFTRFDDRRGPRGERVTTWSVAWPGD